MIPASAIANATPSVLAAGGAAVALNGLILTQSNRVPIGTVQSFPNAAAVSALFGPNSTEYTYANKYFGGPDDSRAKPGALLMAQYPVAAVPAYLRGASLAGVTLATLQAITAGTLTITMDGHPFTAASLNLSGAASFSAVAALIQTGLAAADAVVTAAIAGTTMTVSAVTSGALAVGQAITGAGVVAGTTITALVSGTGGTGTYTVSATQTVASTTITAGAVAVAYDSITQAFTITGGQPGVTGSMSFATGTAAATLGLTAAAGAVTSPGAAATNPTAAMTSIIALTQSFFSFTTVWEPTLSDKMLFAAWNSAQNKRYAYVAFDTDVTPTQGLAPASFGGQVLAAAYEGVSCNYNPTDNGIAPFVMGYAASLDFSATAGRQVAKFRSQAGMIPGVTDLTISKNLALNGYNFYGQYDLANSVDSDAFYANGVVSGTYAWFDSYACQVWLTSALIAAMYSLLRTVPRIPYNKVGSGMIEQALNAPIQAALNFGAITAGVTLSASQIAAVNAAAGKPIDSVLSDAGYYLLVGQASPAVRAARGSPPCTLFYMDGQSVQTLNLASIAGQ